VGEIAKKLFETFHASFSQDADGQAQDRVKTSALPDVLQDRLHTDKPDLVRLLTAPRADFLIDELCPVCGSQERWQWLDGRLLCRVCLVLDLVPLTLQRSESKEPDDMQTHWAHEGGVLTRQQFIEALKAGQAYRRQAALKARITPQESQGGEHREQT
jgi:hypothetical protein